MPWELHPAEPGTEKAKHLLDADLSLKYIGTITLRQALQVIRLRSDELWMEEAVANHGLECITPLGRYDIPGPDDETPWPSAAFRVTLTPWRFEQKPQTGTVCLYRDGDTGNPAAAVGQVFPEWYKGPLKHPVG
jgi:hypothetical protein